MKTLIKTHNIVLMGIKHCGKSSIGKKLAQSFQCEFYDLDDLMEQEYHPDQHVSTREIYINEGKDFFQKLEFITSCKHSNILEQENIIFALGGNTIENKAAMECLKNIGIFIYLKENMDVLYNRIKAGGIPPFLSKKNPYEDFKKVYDFRSKLYEEKADIIVDLQGRTIDQSIPYLTNILKEKKYAG